MQEYLYQKQYAILGVLTKFMTSNQKVVRLLDERFIQWQDLPLELIRPGKPLLVFINESPNTDIKTNTDKIKFIIENEMLYGTAPGLRLSVDRISGYSEVWISEEVLRREQFFKNDILGAIVRFLIISQDRVPLHASTIIRNQTALILYGKSGSGKSTLSYHLLKRGARLLSESAVFISTAGQYCLWGDAQHIFLRPDARDLFPELANYPDKKLPNGKIKIPVELPIQENDHPSCLYFMGRMFLIVLERSELEQSQLRKVAKYDIISKLVSERESGFDLSEHFYETIINLPVDQTYILHSGTDLNAKALLLEALCNHENLTSIL